MKVIKYLIYFFLNYFFFFYNILKYVVLLILYNYRVIKIKYKKN